jgi:hypothetical protein
VLRLLDEDGTEAEHLPDHLPQASSTSASRG